MPCSSSDEGAEGRASSSSPSPPGGVRATRDRGAKASPSSPPTSAFRRPQAFGGMWVIRDVGSSNGTTINGLKAEPNERYELKHTDELSFGGSSSSRCTVALKLCAVRAKELTVEQVLAIEVGKRGDKCKADAEREAGKLRSAFRVKKEQLYVDALAAWKATHESGLRDEERMSVAMQKLGLVPLLGGGGVKEEEAGKENVGAC